MIEPIYERAESFSDGLALVKDAESGRYGYVNTGGELVIPFDYLVAGSFAEGKAWVIPPDAEYRRGYIDTSGTMIIEPQFIGSRRFSEGFAAVRIRVEP